MVVKNMSPGGALLRSSRLFSLPPPIPPPPGDISGTTRFNSDTATQAFPTHQVITTLESSRKRGDWGLKRPLPLRPTTQSSTPMLRVKQLDSIEQITDYAAASNYGMSLKKFHELNMPLTAPTSRHIVKSTATATAEKLTVSVFEEDRDFTHIAPGTLEEATDKRWKFKGPWLAGMTPGEFQKWVVKEVRPKRAAFREFLRAEVARERTKEVLAEAQKHGMVPHAHEARVDPEHITDDELTQFLQRLRMTDSHLQLYNLVGRFLDLAPLAPPTATQQTLLGNKNWEAQLSDNPYAVTGPPVTHPSAGLSYLRTDAFLENHPVYGPQARHAPVEARVLKPRPPAYSHLPAKLGVAGFVADGPLGGDNASNRRGAAMDRLDPSIVGGAKVWVAPTDAIIDSKGRLRMRVTDADAEAVMVARELLGGPRVTQRRNAAAAAGEEEGDGGDEAFDSFEGLEFFKGLTHKRGKPVVGSASEYGLKV